MKTRAACLLFFLSGLAGLVYEVAWVRVLGSVLGNTVSSAALVTAVYMFGLGAGSFVAGRWADRRFGASDASGASGASGVSGASGARSVARAYGLVEIAIAALGLALAFVLPRLGAISASVSTYTRDANGWYEPSLASSVARLGIAALFVAPCAVLLGATLPLLFRAVHASRSTSLGWHAGLLYAVNTAGAAAGALATDLVLVPRIGLLRAQVVAAAVDVAVGVAAVALLRSASTSESASGPARASGPASASTVDVSREAGAPPAVLFGAAFALFASGAGALGLEIVWFRLLGGALGSFRAVLSVLLATILGGLVVGALLGARASAGRAPARAAIHLVLSQAAVCVATLALLALVGRDAFALGGVGVKWKPVVAVVFVPSVFMGFSFPLANAAASHAFARASGGVGLLTLANTVGAVCGALSAAFVLLPLVGTQTSAALFAAASALGPLPLLAARGRSDLGERAARRAFGLAAAAVVPAAIAWAALPGTFLLDRWFPRLPAGSHVVARSEATTEVIAVVDAPGGRRLYTNGHPMSGTSLDGQRYMRAFAHVPLLMQERGDERGRAMVICFGVGNTLHATSLHRSLARVEIADLSRHVLEQAHLFAFANHDVLGDPRVAVYVDDGRQHLRASAPASFDLVTLEPPPIAFAGVAALYSRDFYALAKSRLKPGGMLTNWLPAYQVYAPTTLAIVRAFLDVFPGAVLLSGHTSELVLLGVNDGPAVLDLDRVERNLALEPDVAEDMRRIQIGTLTELAGMFVAGPDVLRRATEGVAPVTDDLPSLEYASGSVAERGQLPTSIFAPEDSRGWCPKCWDGDRPTARVADLAGYQRVLADYYATPEFSTNRRGVVVPLDEARAGVVARSAYLRGLFDRREAPSPSPAQIARLERAAAAAPPGDASAHRELALAYLSAARPADAVREERAALREGGDDAAARRSLGYALARAGDLAGALAEYRRAASLAPADADARYDLAAALLATGDEDAAIAEARRATESDPAHAGANAMLCDYHRARGEAAEAAAACARAGR